MISLQVVQGTTLQVPPERHTLRRLVPVVYHKDDTQKCQNPSQCNRMPHSKVVSRLLFCSVRCMCVCVFLSVCVSLCLCACFSLRCRSKIKPTKEDYTEFTHFSSWCNALSEALWLTPTIHVTVFFFFFLGGGGVGGCDFATNGRTIMNILLGFESRRDLWKLKGCWQAGKLILLLLPDLTARSGSQHI
jgi:hypothetical protein